MAKLMINKHPEKRELDGQDSKVALQKRIRELESHTAESSHILPIESLIVLPDFRNIFPIKDTVLHAICHSMQENGFDPHHPILLWQDHHIVIDGHTRLEAARLSGISHVPVEFLEFETQEQVQNYIFSLQFHRRNLTESDRLQFLIHWIERIGSKKQASGHKKEFVAQLLNVSARTAQKYLNIVQTSLTDVREKVLLGEYSINQGDQMIAASREAKKSLLLQIENAMKPQALPLPTKKTHTQDANILEMLASEPAQTPHFRQYFDQLDQQSPSEILLVLRYNAQLIQTLCEAGALNKQMATYLLNKIDIMINNK
ncbi:MAG: ParB N-terminal domain-containing protein [Spirochaetia bacterium]